MNVQKSPTLDEVEEARQQILQSLAVQREERLAALAGARHQAAPPQESSMTDPDNHSTPINRINPVIHPTDQADPILHTQTDQATQQPNQEGKHNQELMFDMIVSFFDHVDPEIDLPGIEYWFEDPELFRGEDWLDMGIDLVTKLPFWSQLSLESRTQLADMYARFEERAFHLNVFQDRFTRDQLNVLLTNQLHRFIIIKIATGQAMKGDVGQVQILEDLEDLRLEPLRIRLKEFEQWGEDIFEAFSVTENMETKKGKQRAKFKNNFSPIVVDTVLSPDNHEKSQHPRRPRKKARVDSAHMP
ncbi:uncharacterized protein IL334_002785 [Kwoniella shivajii]|uniref:Uncharacterized protein n=1 Tax=Kwoniella shivajii TaxID=564305 RepID=A0ABZ1CWZ4_9TREE|nr:hypothetical protein IL334_002785 [Kwoniella shivajii]